MKEDEFLEKCLSLGLDTYFRTGKFKIAGEQEDILAIEELSQKAEQLDEIIEVLGTTRPEDLEEVADVILYEMGFDGGR